MESGPTQEPSENDTAPSRSQRPRRTAAQGTEATYNLCVIEEVHGPWACLRFAFFILLPYLILISAFVYTLLVSKTARPAIPVLNQLGNNIQLIAATVVFLTSLVLQPLTNRMWNLLRWKMGTKHAGIPYLSFLVLGPSTTTWGLVEVVMGDIYSKFRSQNDRDPQTQTPGLIPGRSIKQQVRVCLERTLLIVAKTFSDITKWLTSYPGLAFLRLFLQAAFFIQNICLLPGISVIELGDPSTSVHFSLLGGVLPYNDSFLQEPASRLLWHAHAMYGTMGNFSLWDRPTILTGTSPSCPKLQFSHLLDYTDFNDGRFLDLKMVPMYSIVLSELDQRGFKDCRIYGYRNARLKLCMDKDEEGNLIFGGETCAYEYGQPEFCEDSSLWDPLLTLSMSITKGYANIEYRFPERLVEGITIVREEPPLEPLPLETYWSLFDKLFPRYKNAYPGPHSCATDFFLETLLTVHLTTRQVELFYLPWLLQETDLTGQPANNLEENMILTTSTERVNHLQWAWGSLWTFYGCIALNLLMNIVVFIWVYETIPVELASLADVDFANSYFNMKQLGEDTALKEAYCSLEHLTTRELVTKLCKIQLRFIPKTDPKTGPKTDEDDDEDEGLIRPGGEGEP